MQSAAYLLVFLGCVVALAKVSASKTRQAILLVASYGLYLTWTRWFTAVLIFSVLINFALGKWLKKNPTSARLWTGISFNLLLLGAFKYIPEVSIHLPFASMQ